MAVTPYKPTTPGRRGMTTADKSAITRKKPVKSLLRVKKSQAGRNNQGRITVRHRGGGVKKFYRVVSSTFPEGFEATVEGIEYDPNRSANIALVRDSSDKPYYVIAGGKVKTGQTIRVGEDAPIEPGNRLPLSAIPTGTVISDIELTIGKGGQMVRSAGAGAQLMAKEGKYAQVRLPSGEVRMVNLRCQATIGSVGNEQHQNIKYGTAGRRRKMGWRPSVKGRAMNAADHPMGGGDGGKGSLGGHPMTPWGQKALGKKTRTRKDTNKFIVRTKHQAKRKR